MPVTNSRDQEIGFLMTLSFLVPKPSFVFPHGIDPDLR